MHGSGLGRRRWVVERTFAWLNQFRRLRVRYDKRADILQFQFHRALSKIAGCGTPLHRCSIYESQEAGKRLNAMLTMGQSKPWPEALDALTGSTQMDATAILDYFAPLSKWLDEQLAGRPVGW